MATPLPPTPGGPAVGIGIGIAFQVSPVAASPPPPPGSPELDFSKATNSMYVILGVV